MKRLYSVILLFSFLIGALQPILPMIEYQLFRGNVLELFDSETESFGTVSDVLIYTQGSDEDQNEDADQGLLDDDYYPLAVQITTVPQPKVFPLKTRLYLPGIRNVSGPAYLPNPPPPRLS